MAIARKTRPAKPTVRKAVVIRADQVAPVAARDLAAWDTLPEDQIDTTDIPELSDADIVAMKRAAKAAGGYRAKKLISLRVDEQVLSFFKTMGPGYQRRMHAVLRSYAERAAVRQR